MISEVTTNQALDAIWPLVEPMVIKALRDSEGDCRSSDVIRESVRTKKFMCWVIHEGKKIEAILILSVKKYEFGKIIFVHIMAGKGIDKWGDEVEQLLIDFAQLQGASAIEASCRKGLAKYLSRRPRWRQKAVIMEIPHQEIGD